jgi:hypothetical protein
VQDADITDGNAFPNEVEVDLDMLHTLMLNRVVGEIDGTNVITVDESALWQLSLELLKELPEPTSFSNTVSHVTILSLGARSGDDNLALGGPRDEVIVEEHNIARGGLVCTRATRPVRIRVDCQLVGGGGASQVEAEVQEASQIAQHSLHHNEVRLLRIIHMKANLLDDVGDVRAGERQVLEGPGEAPKLSWISNMRPRSDRDIGLSVHMRWGRLVVHHASVLKDVESELALSEKESIYLMLYGDPKKIMKRAEVLHGELKLDGRYGVLQEHCARHGEHNVINIKQQVCRIGATVEDEQGGVGLGLNKS